MTTTGASRGLDLFRDQDIPIYTLTFARDLAPEELLTRMGADPKTLAPRGTGAALADDLGDDLYDGDEPVVMTGVDGPWTWAWELGGLHGLDERVLGAVSAGTEAVVVHYNEKPMHWFKYAADGDVLVDFHTLHAIDPIGYDPARLDATMRPLGLVRGETAPPDSVLTLLENAFGISLTDPATVGGERWSGRLRALPQE
ncbi:DUF6461 domain-containing protein [Streptomyces sp. NPDC093970]|uniref:DUF6461 domain-containing protein n=1 Tax=Streptomyces sp. NPDC093970 TaxID=3155076 RepID=UPI00343E7E18